MTDVTEQPEPHAWVGPLGPVVSRRQFLKGSAALSLGAVMAGHTQAVGALMSAVGAADAGPASTTPNFTFSVLRDTDLALLDFSFYGFAKRVVKGVVTLAPTSASNIVTVRFPPQAIGEAAYNWTGGTWNVDPPPVLSAVSGPSYLCFTLRDGRSVPFTTMTDADLLDWEYWSLLVPAGAQVDGATPGPPTNPVTEPPTTTYIEYPFALLLSPTRYVGTGTGFSTTFTSRTTPLVGPNAVTDLWTATLAQTVGGVGPQVPQVVAVWATDYALPTSGDVTQETYITYVP